MILALCGTVEGKILLEKLTKEFSMVMATVTTPYGVKCLGEKYPNVEVLQRKLQQEELNQLIDEKPIKTIIDVSHPYAQQISTIAIEACKEKGIAYLRYEREATNLMENPHVIKAEDFNHAVELAKGFKGKIFLTIGSNHISLFTKEISVNRLIVRVLPTSNVLKLCEEQGLSPDNIIAMKGPFSEELNRVMFSMDNISVVVTKDSGGAGGTEEKINAAKSLGIPIILVKRPNLTYGMVYHNLDDLVRAIKK